VVRFYVELLVHTKGAHARHVFRLATWQEYDLVRPIFGEVVWSPEWQRYIRRYRVVIIVLARKNGKSALLSGTALYLLVGDDEESAEVYGAAKDTKQAGKVFEPALRMMQLSPLLSKRLDYNKNARRLIDERTASYYEIITADAEGELGHNPHGFILDEVLSQPDDSLWNAMRTAGGTRTQPLMLCITTETNDDASFGASVIDEADRIQEDPSRAPHMFAYVRKLPMNEVELDRLRRLFPGHPDLPVSCDPFDEANWRWPNPGLDDFKTRSSMREEKLEALNDPTKENAFRQFQVNQRVQQVTRYVSLQLWDANVGETMPSPSWLRKKLAGQVCWAGLDLSSKLDLTAWCLLFEDGWCWWRFWVPEAVVPLLDKHTAGKFSVWVRDGWVTATEGNTIHFERIYDDIETDWNTFLIRNATYDRWCGEPVRQAIEARTGLEMFESDTTYANMSGPMQEFLRLLKAHELQQGGNPVARWNADNLQAKMPADDPDRVRPVKPDREKTGKRIDGMPALFFAIDARMRPVETEEVIVYHDPVEIGPSF
jgi:phage terminase large subunit-like protein